jgi:hypothetical protein
MLNTLLVSSRALAGDFHRLDLHDVTPQVSADLVTLVYGGNTG